MITDNVVMPARSMDAIIGLELHPHLRVLGLGCLKLECRGDANDVMVYASCNHFARNRFRFHES